MVQERGLIHTGVYLTQTEKDETMNQIIKGYSDLEKKGPYAAIVEPSVVTRVLQDIAMRKGLPPLRLREMYWLTQDNEMVCTDSEENRRELSDFLGWGVPMGERTQ